MLPRSPYRGIQNGAADEVVRRRVERPQVEIRVAGENVAARDGLRIGHGVDAGEAHERLGALLVYGQDGAEAVTFERRGRQGER